LDLQSQFHVRLQRADLDRNVGVCKPKNFVSDERAVKTGSDGTLSGSNLKKKGMGKC
jgi:hypothetical protein